MDQLLRFSPSPITFELTPGNETKTYLRLQNVSKHPVVYKVKTNNVFRYCVIPNAAIIEPNAKMDLKLAQRASKGIPKDLNRCRDKFMLCATRVDLLPSGNNGGSFHGFDSTLQLWMTVPRESILKAKVPVILKMASSSREQHTKQKDSVDSSENFDSIMTPCRWTEGRSDSSVASPENTRVVKSGSNVASQRGTIPEPVIEAIAAVESDSHVREKCGDATGTVGMRMRRRYQKIIQKLGNVMTSSKQ